MPLIILRQLLDHAAEIERSIRFGVRKVNIDTDCRIAMSGAMRRFVKDNPQSFDPRAFILAAMAQRNADGTLNPAVAPA